MAQKALAAVCGHWQIENKLDWSLDVAFREDDSRFRAENAAENFARRLAVDRPLRIGAHERRVDGKQVVAPGDMTITAGAMKKRACYSRARVGIGA